MQHQIKVPSLNVFKLLLHDHLTRKHQLGVVIKQFPLYSEGQTVNWS